MLAYEEHYILKPLHQEVPKTKKGEISPLLPDKEWILTYSDLLRLTSNTSFNELISNKKLKG